MEITGASADIVRALSLFFSHYSQFSPLFLDIGGENVFHTVRRSFTNAI